MHSTHPYFYGATKRPQASSRLYKSFINYVAQPWPQRRPSRLMPATAGERCADANIFAFARNTVRVRRHLQGIGIQSYHRRRRQSTYKCPQLTARQRSRPPRTLSISMQTCSQKRPHFPHLCTCPQTHAHVLSNVCPWTRLCAFTETFSSAHLCCAAMHTIISSPRRTAGGGREGESSWLSRQYLEL